MRLSLLSTKGMTFTIHICIIYHTRDAYKRPHAYLVSPIPFVPWFLMLATSSSKHGEDGKQKETPGKSS
jgi:hypothetical protein